MAPTAHMPGPILVVDDETAFLQSASFALRSSGFSDVATCSDSRQAMAMLREKNCSLVLLDILMPFVTGRELLPRIAEEFPGVPVIMLTALNEVETAVECMKGGAFDYLLKPVDKARLVTSVKKALERVELLSENARLRDSMLCEGLHHPEAFEEIVTRSACMHALLRYVEAIAPTTLPVLVTGETGTGKELIAQAVHKASGRTGEYVAVNVGGLDDTLFSDTLFGHERGAFTGADRQRTGLIKSAAGGTLFLDEIGEMKPESQIKLLRLLENKTYYPVGSDSAASTDVRIVVATNALIDPALGPSNFRKDLYYRLQTHHIRLPPLRQRKEDIEPLLEHFLEAAAEEFKKKVPTPPPELLVLLNTYDYPGNVRELRGMVFDAVSRHQGGVLSMDSFKEHVRKDGRTPVPEASSLTPGADQHGRLIFTDQLPTLREADELLIAEAMRRSKSNQSIAAGMLGITRSALNKRLNQPRE